MKVRYLLLFLFLSNTFSLQHMAFVRKLYPGHITERKLFPSNALKRQAMNDIIENMMELISMKFRTGKRNTDQPGPGSDVRKIENIMKLIDMKFRKRNIRNSEENNSNQRDENEEKLTELRDNMEKRSFSSLRIRHDGKYIF